MSTQRLRLGVIVAALVALALTGCGGGSGTTSSNPAAASSAGQAQAPKTADKHGPINIWWSNNQDEVKWGNAALGAWNSAHPDEKVSAQEIPTSKSSEDVINAAIPAGTTPCLVYNVAPAAVNQFQEAGGLVNLSGFSGGASYIETRTGTHAEQFQSSDGGYYQMPWKQNPVLIFYNKDVFRKAGLDPDNPPLGTYEQFLQTSKTIVSKGAAQWAIAPTTSNEFYQSWFDFYPTYAAATNGTPLVDNGKATFNDQNGKDVANFWRSMYAAKVSPTEIGTTEDMFAQGKSAMAIVGPWATPTYKDLDYGVVTLPTKSGASLEDTYTFSDEKSVGMFTNCKNMGTAWDFLKFTTSVEQDNKLLEATGQLPVRTDLESVASSYFSSHPLQQPFAKVSSHVVEAPVIPNSIEVWQTFRDNWVNTVIFGKGDIDKGLADTAAKIDNLVSQ